MLVIGNICDAAPVAAQAGGPFDLSWFTVDSGGSSTGGSYGISSSVGQPDAGGPQSGGPFQLSGGFLHTGASSPLAVTLGWFLAERDGDRVDFRWQTTTENGTAGFHVLAESDGGRVQLNADLIPSSVIDSVTPTDYAFTRATVATRFYLQEVGVDGRIVEYGPFELDVEAGIYVPKEGDGLRPVLWLPVILN